MKEKLTVATGTAPLGLATGKKLLKIESGQYAGRLIALIQTAADEIAFTFADRPYKSWSVPVTVASDAADLPFDCAMSKSGDVHVVYTQASTGYLVARRLYFSGGSWSPASAVAVYNGDSRQPSIVIDPSGDLHVAWTLVSGGLHIIQTKSSGDHGASWGSGPTDAGDALTTGASYAYARLVCDALNLHAVYVNGGVQVMHRSLALGGGSWSDANVLGTGFGLTADFDAAVASDNRVGVVWNDEALKYREYDGALWGPVTTLDSDGGACPQIRFADSVPIVVYLSELAAGQTRLMCTIRRTGVFTVPTVFDKRNAALDSVVLYDSGSAAFADLTTAAADATTADLFHPATSVLVQNAGDAVYAGMDVPFRRLRLLLSTAGSGGTAAFSYWDGSSWQAFVPYSGAAAFDSVDNEVVLWEDGDAIPGDWQKRVVSGVSRFWIRAEVVSPFTTPPVGSRLTAVGDLRAVIVRR